MLFRLIERACVNEGTNISQFVNTMAHVEKTVGAYVL